MGGPLRFALVGAGAIAQSYAAAFRRTPSARLVAVVDRRPAAARALAEAEGCVALDAVGDELRASGAEAAVLCTPPVTHAPLATRLLEAGLDVLCEKPLALDLAEARRMVAVAAGCGRRLAMASKFRHVADVLRARSLLAGGLLGDVVLYENTFAARVDMSRRWNSDPATSGGGVLIDNGCHAADLLRFLLGPIEAVLAVEAPRVAGLAVEETVRLLARTAGGVLGTCDLSWSVAKEVDTYAAVHGARGVLTLGWRESRYRLAGAPDATAFGSGYDKVAAFAAQLANFVAAVRGEEELLVSTEDALASVAVTEAAYRSLAEARWVGIGEVARTAAGSALAPG